MRICAVGVPQHGRDTWRQTLRQLDAMHDDSVLLLDVVFLEFSKEGSLITDHAIWHRVFHHKCILIQNRHGAEELCWL
jgi:hypothetical protein